MAMATSVSNRAKVSNPAKGTGKWVKVSGKVVDQFDQPIENLKVGGCLTYPSCDGVPGRPQTKSCEQQTDSHGRYELPFPVDGPGGTLCVMFPRRHEHPDGSVFVLKLGYRVDIEACEGEVAIPDRRYESGTCMLSGFVEREVVGRDGSCSEYEAIDRVTVQILDCKGDVIGTKSTDTLGKFSLPMPKEGPLYLRFQPELSVDGQTWRLEEPEREVLAPCDRPFNLGDTVRYVLCRARITGAITDGKSGLAGFPVKLVHSCAEHCDDTTTDSNGCYCFDDVPPGSIRLIFRAMYCDDRQNEWELTQTSQAVHCHEVKAGALVPAATVIYEPEKHTIACSVKLPGGQPAANRVVRVLDEHEREVAVQMTDCDGNAIIDVVRRGRYKVTVYPDAAAAGVPYSQTVSVNSQTPFSAIVADVRSIGEHLDDIAADIGKYTAQGIDKANAALTSLTDRASSRLGAVGEAVIDSSTYPVLTEAVSFPYPTGGGAGGGGYGGGAAARGAALGPMVEGAIREVLGWRPKPTDPKGFVAALNQSFDRLAVEGHTECKWNERSYAAQVTTDMGAVTGAQASIFARAKVAIDQSIPLVQGLYPLSPNVLQEDIDSIRSLVVRELTTLGTELGIVGGPRVQRVDELFRLLLGVKPGQSAVQAAPTKDPEQVGGHIGILGERLSLARQYINTIQDEQNFTNFLIVIDYVGGLKQSWETYRPYFARSPGAEPFFGTQLVLLSRALTAVGEAVEEVNFAMDSVFLGPAERQTIELHFRDDHAGKLVGRSIALPWVPGNSTKGRTGPPYRIPYTFDADAAPLFIAELLDWAAALPPESAPMLDDSGKDGLIAVFTNVDKLRKLVHGAKMQSYNGAQLPGQPLPAGYRTPRVQRALGELADALDEAAKLAGEIKAREAVARRDLQDLPVVETLQDAMQDPALLRQLAAALAPIIAAAQAAKNNGQ